MFSSLMAAAAWSASRFTIFSASFRETFFCAMTSLTRVSNGLSLNSRNSRWKHGNVEFFLPPELPKHAFLILSRGRPAIVNQHLFERGEVHVEVETVVRFLRENERHVLRIDALIVRLLENAPNAFDDACLHELALVGRELACNEKVAVGAETLVSLKQRAEARGMLLAPPVLEIAEEAACLFRTALAAPGVPHRQAIEERIERDGQKLLTLSPLVRARRHRWLLLLRVPARLRQWRPTKRGLLRSFLSPGSSRLFTGP